MCIVKYDRWNVVPHVPNKVYFDIKEWDGVTHIINTPWRCSYEGEIGKVDITLKTGFVTDGGSVPELFWNIISPWGKNTIAFLMHDGIYAGELLEREQADWILLEMMEYCGTNWFERNSAWRCVRNFGDSIWENHTKELIAYNRSLMEFKWTK